MMDIKERRWLDRNDAAAYLGVSVNTISRWVRAGILATHRLPEGDEDAKAPARTWYDRHEIDRVLEENAQRRGQSA